MKSGSAASRAWLLVVTGWGALRARGLRTALTVIGIAIGIAAGVATAAATQTASSNLGDRFDAFAATLVTARMADVDVAATGPEAAALQRVASIDGVEQAGVFAASTSSVTLSRVAHSGVAAAEGTGDLRVVAASPAAGAVLGAELVAGRWFDAGHDRRGDDVAVLDTVAAERLGLAEEVGIGRSVQIQGRPHVVLGVVRAPEGDPHLLGAVIVPPSGVALPGIEIAQWDVLVRTRIGAASVVGSQLPVALAPRGPGSVTVLIPADLTELKAGVAQDTQALFYGLALVSLVVAGVGTGNTLIVSVMERRGEIGLRRALGASRRAIATQFLVEGGLLGLAGGVIGSCLGYGLAVAIAASRGWILTVDPWVPAAGPLCGVITALVAAIIPALSAARTQPVSALRS